jgi:hypothetical protein
MPRTTIARVLSLSLLAGAALAGCGDSTEPRDDTLSRLDDAIFEIMVTRMVVMSPAAEPTDLLEIAMGTPIRALRPFPAELAGQTLAYQDGAWAVDGDRPPVPDDVARIIWHELFGQAVGVSERGYIDLTDLDATTPGRIRVEYVRTDGGVAVVGNYTMRSQLTGTLPVATNQFEAAGFLGDGTSQVNFQLQESASENQNTGDTSVSLDLHLSDSGFTYVGSLDESLVAATQASMARCEAAITLDGATTAVEIEVEGVGATPTGATGLVRHAGQTLAVLTENGFQKPDGGSFTGLEQDRLLGIVARLCTPLEALPDFFR